MEWSSRLCSFKSGYNWVGPFRYAVLYNQTKKKLIGFYDNTFEVVLAPQETFTVHLKYKDKRGRVVPTLVFGQSFPKKRRTKRKL